MMNTDPSQEPESPAKFMIALGGFLGFSLVFFASYFSGNPVIYSLSFASISGWGCAFFMKMIAVYIEKNLDRIRLEKAAEIRRKQEEEEEGPSEDALVSAPPSQETPDIRQNV